MSRDKDLTFIDGRERLKNRPDSRRVDPVFRFLNQVDFGGAWQVGEHCQGEQTQGSIREHPRWYFDAVFIACQNVAGPVRRLWHRRYVSQIRQRRA